TSRRNTGTYPSAAGSSSEVLVGLLRLGRSRRRVRRLGIAGLGLGTRGATGATAATWGGSVGVALRVGLHGLGEFLDGVIDDLDRRGLVAAEVDGLLVHVVLDLV